MADYLGMGEETSLSQISLNQTEQRARIANTQATTRHTDATSGYLSELSRGARIQGDQAQLEYDVDAKIKGLNEIAQEGNNPEQLTPMEQLTRDADLYMKAGLVRKGTDLLKAATTMTSQMATAAAKTVQAQAQKEQAQAKAYEKYAALLSNAKTPQDWETAKEMAAAEFGPDAASQMNKLGEFSPAKARLLSDSLLKKKDALAEANRARRTEIYEKTQETVQEKNRATAEAARKRGDLERDREERLAKVGGTKGGRGTTEKPAGMPSKAELTGVEGQLKELNLPTDSGTTGEIAQEARKLWKNNPGLTPEMAAAQVIQNKIRNKDLVPGQNDTNFWGNEVKGKGQAFSANRPVALPSDPKKFIKGQYYQTPQGVVRYVDGVNDELVGDK